MEYWDVRDAITNEPVSFREYTTGKTQASVIQECVDYFAGDYTGETKKIILKGGVGSGKSLIALNIARFFDKATVVVPRKILQEQYLNDYYGPDKKLVIMKDEEPLKITTYKGRGNFPCLIENTNADDIKLPCTRVLHGNERRIDAGRKCKHWSPLYSTMNMTEATIADIERTHEPVPYKSVIDEKTHYVSECGACPYYQQFSDMQKSDAIIVNNKKFLIELMLGRMPASEILIIDEFDFFLDELNSKYALSTQLIAKKIESIKNSDSKVSTKVIEEALEEYETYTNSFKLMDYKKTDVKLLINSEETKIFLDILAEKTSNLPGFENIARNAALFLRYAKETVFEIENRPTYSYTKDDSYLINFSLLNFKELMQDIISKYKYFVGMSGTFQSSTGILEEMYGLSDVKYIKSERDISGTLKILQYKKTMPYTYMNMRNHRETFLESLNDVLGKCKAKGQTLVHVKSFETDCLRKNESKEKYPHIVSAYDLRSKQQLDVNNHALTSFKKKLTPILFSTKYYRGVDLPDDECRFVILPRVPFEAQHDIFWKGLKMKYEALGRSSFFNAVYVDKMIRELTQAVARGLRHPNDLVHVVYIDSRLGPYLKRIAALTTHIPTGTSSKD
jgi:Rad3-related DNA helicase